MNKKGTKTVKKELLISRDWKKESRTSMIQAATLLNEFAIQTTRMHMILKTEELSSETKWKLDKFRYNLNSVIEFLEKVDENLGILLLSQKEKEKENAPCQSLRSSLTGSARQFYRPID